MSNGGYSHNWVTVRTTQLFPNRITGLAVGSTAQYKCLILLENFYTVESMGYKLLISLRNFHYRDQEVSKSLISLGNFFLFDFNGLGGDGISLWSQTVTFGVVVGLSH